MEYNKTQFSKTSDKKVLHKVRKNWVVLSTALLMALGGGAVVASGTTSANADANNNNGNNNTAADGISTLKNRINANLTKGYQQSNQNAKTVPASSKDISNQANALHNRILANASTSRNNSTANGRQAANNNNGAAELNHRIQESVSAPEVGAPDRSNSNSSSNTPNYSSTMLKYPGDKNALHVNNAPITLAYENNNGTLQRTRSDKARIVQATVRLGGYKNNLVAANSTPENQDIEYGGFTFNPSDERYQVKAGGYTQNFSDNFALNKDADGKFLGNNTKDLYKVADVNSDSPAEFSASFGSDADEFSWRTPANKVADKTSDKTVNGTNPKNTLKSGVNWDATNHRPLIVLKPNEANTTSVKVPSNKDNNIEVNYVDQNGQILNKGTWGDNGSTNSTSNTSDTIKNLKSDYGSYINIVNKSDGGINNPDSNDYYETKTGDSANLNRDTNKVSDFNTKYMYKVTNFHQNVTVPLMGRYFASDTSKDKNVTNGKSDHDADESNGGNSFTATITLRNHSDQPEGHFTVTKLLGGRIGDFKTVKPEDIIDWLRNDSHVTVGQAKNGASLVSYGTAQGKTTRDGNGKYTALADLLATYTNDADNKPERMYVQGDNNGAGVLANADPSKRFVRGSINRDHTVTFNFDANAQNADAKPGQFTVHYLANINGHETSDIGPDGKAYNKTFKMNGNSTNGSDISNRYGDVIDVADTQVDPTNSSQYNQPDSNDSSNYASDNYGIKGLAVPTGYHFVPGQDTHYHINGNSTNLYYYLAGNTITPSDTSYQHGTLSIHVEFLGQDATTPDTSVHGDAHNNTNGTKATGTMNDNTGNPAINSGTMDFFDQSFPGLRESVGNVYNINPAKYDALIKKYILNSEAYQYTATSDVKDIHGNIVKDGNGNPEKHNVTKTHSFSVQPANENSDQSVLYGPSSIENANSNDQPFNDADNALGKTVQPNKNNNNITLNFTVTENPTHSQYHHIYVHYVTPSDPYSDISTVYDASGNAISDVDTTVSDAGHAGSDFNGKAVEEDQNNGSDGKPQGVPEGYQFVKVLGTDAKYNLNNHHTISNHDSIDPAGDTKRITKFGDTDQNEVIEVVPRVQGITVNYVDQYDPDDKNYDHNTNHEGHTVKTVFIPGDYGSVTKDLGYSRYGERVNLSDGHVDRADEGGYATKAANQAHHKDIVKAYNTMQHYSSLANTAQLEGNTDAENEDNKKKDQAADNYRSELDNMTIPDDAISSLGVPNGFHTTQETTDYTFNKPGKQSLYKNNVYNIMVAGNHKSDTASDTAKINIWEENPNGDQSSAKLADTVPDTINGDVNDTYSINANEFTPNGYTPNPIDQEVKGTIMQNGLSGLNDDKTVNFYYKPNSTIPWNQLGHIYVLYVQNTNGQKVWMNDIAPRQKGYTADGYTQPENDYAGEPVNVTTRSWDGYNPPTKEGWLLDPSDNTNTSFSMNPGQPTLLTLKVYNPATYTSGNFNIIQNLITSDTSAAAQKPMGVYTKTQGETGKKNSAGKGTANGGFDVYGHNYKVRGFKFAPDNGTNLPNTNKSDIQGKFTSDGIDPEYGTWDYVASRTNRPTNGHPSDDPVGPNGGHATKPYNPNQPVGPNNPQPGTPSNPWTPGNHQPNQPGKFGPNTSDAEPIYVQFYKQLNNGKEVPIKISDADNDSFDYLTTDGKSDSPAKKSDFDGDIRVDGYMDQNISDVAKTAIKSLKDSTKSSDAPYGYHLMDNPRLNYTIDHQAQQVDLDIRSNSDTAPFTVYTKEEIPTSNHLEGKSGQPYTIKDGKPYTVRVSDNTNDIIKPSDYTPADFELDTSNNRDKDVTVQNTGNNLTYPNSTTSFTSTTFYYKEKDSNSDATIRPIDVTYIDQHGDNVTSDGHGNNVDHLSFPANFANFGQAQAVTKGESLDVYQGANDSKYVPNGYHLNTNVDNHITNPTFGDNTQHVDVLVDGNSETIANQFTTDLRYYNASNGTAGTVSDVSNDSNPSNSSHWTISGNVGDVVTITPSKVLSDSRENGGYRIIPNDPSDVDVQVRILPNNKIQQLNGANQNGVAQPGHRFDAEIKPSGEQAGALEIKYESGDGTIVSDGVIDGVNKGTVINNVTAPSNKGGNDAQGGYPLSPANQNNWQLAPNQNLGFKFTSSSDSTKIVRVEGQRVNRKFGVTLFGLDNNGTVIHKYSDNNVSLPGRVGDFTPVDASQFTTEMDNDAHRDGDNSNYFPIAQGLTEVMFNTQGNGLTPDHTYFVYQRTGIQEGKPMYVRYWDQNGKLVNPRYTSDQYELNSDGVTTNNSDLAKKSVHDANGHAIVLHHTGDPIEEITADKDFGYTVNVTNGNGGSSLGRINDSKERIDNRGIDGVAIPSGYRLATTGPNSNPDQRTIYTFDADQHVINLNVTGVGASDHGKNVPPDVANTNSDNTVTIHVHKNHMNNGRDQNNGVSDSRTTDPNHNGSDDTTYTFHDSDAVGSHDILNPANYAPKGYHNTLSDSDAIINKNYSTTMSDGNPVTVNGLRGVQLNEPLASYQYPTYSDNMHPDYATSDGGKTIINNHDSDGNIIMYGPNNQSQAVSYDKLSSFKTNHTDWAPKQQQYVGRIYVAPKNVYFNYDQDNYQAAPLKVVYVNQDGNQVGRSDTISGSLDQIVNVEDPSDGGIAVPKGYTLDGGFKSGQQDKSITNGSGQPITTDTNAKVGVDQDLDYGLTNKPQTVYLHVTGNPFNGGNGHSDESKTIKPMTVIVIDHNDNGSTTVDLKAYKPTDNINGQAINNGDTFEIDPSDPSFAPNLGADTKSNKPNTPLYHMSSSDAVQYGQVGSNGALSPNEVTFNYYQGAGHQGRAIIHYYYKNTGAQVGNPQVITGSINSDFHKKINNDNLPTGYHIDSSWNSTIPRTITNSPQDIYVPVDGDDYGNEPYTIYLITRSMNNQGHYVSDHTPYKINGSDFKQFEGIVGSDTEIDPYTFIGREQGQQGEKDGFDNLDGLKNYHVDPEDQDINLHVDNYGNVEPGNIITYVFDKDFKPETIGAVKINYYDPDTDPHAQHPIDTVSDHGLNGSKFILSPYEEDVPSELTSQYYIALNNGDAQNGTDTGNGLVVKDESNSNNNVTIEKGNIGRNSSNSKYNNYYYFDYGSSITKPIDVYIPVKKFD